MNHRRPFRIISATASCVVVSLLLAANAQAFVGQIAVGLGRLNDVGEIKTSFSADAKLETEEMNVDTRIFYQPGMVRDEVNVGGQRMVTIHRFDLNKVWMIMGEGMYMESEPDQGSQQAPEFKLISREIIGPETVNGMKTTKYKSIYETKDGKFGGFTWYTDDNIAVKGFLVHQTKGEKQRVKFELMNLERGAQPDSLFEIPKGYQKFNMGGMPGMPNMQGMGGMGPGGRGIPGYPKRN
jgi:hypothetical protein